MEVGDRETMVAPICPLSVFFLAFTGFWYAGMIKASHLGSFRLGFLSGGWKGTERSKIETGFIFTIFNIFLLI